MRSIDVAQELPIITSEVPLLKPVGVALLLDGEAVIKEEATYFSLLKSEGPRLTSVADVLLSFSQ